MSATPFGYSYSSVSAVFAKELGRIETGIIDAKSQYLYLPGKVSLPANLKMSPSGMIIPESAIAVKEVEFCFATVRTYVYYLNRLSGEKWEKEQLRDVNIREILANEHGKTAVLACLVRSPCRCPVTPLQVPHQKPHRTLHLTH